MTEAVVLHAYNEHDALVIFEGAPYLMYLDSTTGLSMGQEVTAAPVFVSGTATAQIDEGMTASLTVLQTLGYEELKEAIYGPAGSDPSASSSADSSSVAGSPSVPGQPSTSGANVSGRPSAPGTSPRTGNVPTIASGNAPRNGLYAPPSPSGARLWYDRSGKFSVEAVLLQASETEVVLRRLDGKIIRVPRNTLSDADQIYLRK
jgi:hypothetical protein